MKTFCVLMVSWKPESVVSFASVRWSSACWSSARRVPLVMSLVSSPGLALHFPEVVALKICFGFKLEFRYVDRVECQY